MTTNSAGYPSIPQGVLKTITLVNNAARTLTVADSGSVIFMPTNAGDATITLPTAAAANAGTNYLFIATAVGAATAYTIRPVAGGNVSFTVRSRAAATTSTIANVTAADFVKTGAAANLGPNDRLYIQTDGVAWYGDAYSSIGAAAGWLGV